MGAPGRPSDAMVRITVLVDNVAGRMGLAEEHGLSLLVETNAGSILFDTGAGAALEVNTGVLGARLGRVEAVVLSHGHYDHTGGLPWVLTRARRARVFLHPEAVRTRYSLGHPDRPRSIGMPAAVRAALDRRRSRVIRQAGPVFLQPFVFLTGGIPRRHAWEDPGGPFFLDTAGREPDPLPDDQALGVITDKGLVVLLGCGHAGVVNTLEAARRVGGMRRIRAVLGGLHLLHAGPERLDKTAAFLRRHVRECVAPGHCTGTRAMRRLRSSLGSIVQPFRSGDCWRYE